MSPLPQSGWKWETTWMKDTTEKYYVRRKARNDEADQLYSDILEEETDGLYILDIIRGGIQNDDPRIPRNLSE